MSNPLTYPIVIVDGITTITKDTVIRRQQGAWKWQVRLGRNTYMARESNDHQYRWWRLSTGPDVSGGNIRSGGWIGESSPHRRRLTAVELYALSVARGE